MFGRIVSSWSHLSASLKFRLKVLAGVIVLFLLVVLGGLIFYQFQSQETVKSEEGKTGDGLIFAQTICRHGDRNPYISYPNDPWKSDEFWPGGYYQLTELGKQQHYELGQYLRNRYTKLIGDDENAAKRVYVESTEKPRVIESAQANLAGFSSFDDHFNTESIPIHIIPVEEDYVLATEKPCDHFEYVMIEYENTTAYTGLFDENEPLIKYLEKHSGLELRTITDITNLYDTLFIERLKNFRLPSWTEEVMRPQSVFEYLAFQWYVIFTPTTEMKKLRTGFLLKEILNRFTNKTQSTDNSSSLRMSFAHDITIANMLNSLGVFELHIPPYASCMFFELYQNNTTPFVQIFYRNSTQMDVPPLEIPNCGIKCSLSRLYELYDDILPKKNVDEECELRDGEILPPGGNPETNSL